MKRQEEERKSEQRYVDILSNGGFKAFFGDENNKAEVMSIINTFLPEHRRVVSIDYLPTEHQGPVVGVNKEFHYDFMCRDENGVVFIVEMQKYEDRNWFKRCVSYASRAYDKQNREGEDYGIPPVYLIGLMGVEIGHPDKEFWKDRFVSEYTFREKESHDLLEETIVIIFVELAHFNKAEDNCQSELERTLYLLKNSKTMSKPPIWYDEGKYGKILETWEIEGFDENKRNKYDSDMNDEKRRLSELNTAIAKSRAEGFVEGREEGIVEGRAEGFVEGREEGVVKGKLEDAKNCKVLGISVDVIVKITGLSEEVVANL